MVFPGDIAPGATVAATIVAPKGGPLSAPSARLNHTMCTSPDAPVASTGSVPPPSAPGARSAAGGVQRWPPSAENEQAMWVESEQPREIQTAAVTPALLTAISVSPSATLSGSGCETTVSSMFDDASARQ